MVQSFTRFHRNAYLQQAQDLVILESIILQTLASKDLAQTSYFMATNSLHLTTFSLQYSPPIVACVCIHLACKWSNWEIPVSADEKHWWEYVDPTVTLELLDGSGKSKDKHREHSSNHRHHHHSHKNPRAATGSKRSSDSSSSSKHSTPQSGASSRKRPHFDESVAAMPHNHQPKAGQKSSRSYQPPLPPLPPSSSSSSSSSASQQFGFLDLPFMQQQPAGGSGKVPSSDANGHGTNSQPNDYQDTFDMLNSLLSAQGVQPAPPPQFDYVPSPYGEYRYPGLPLRANPGNRGSSRPPPLPADPPPPLPPLPK
ncbi:UNVERIFIED_CONTAM: hypothetical protein FKN15_068211 [Acipenser sinensis]